MSADSTVTITINAVDGSGPVLSNAEKNLMAVSETGRTAAASLKEIGGGSVALEQVSQAASRAGAAHGSLRAQIGLLDNTIRGAHAQAMADVIRLFSRSAVVMEALPIAATIGGIALLGGGIAEIAEKIKQWNEAQEKLARDTRDFGTAIQNTFNGLDQQLLEAQKRADELRGNHLAALQKELQLIDKQTMSDLVEEFAKLEKAADDFFKDLPAHWYSAGIGAAGAQNALAEFKSQYNSLLAQGKDKEASDLLQGTDKTAHQILDDIQLAQKYSHGIDVTNKQQMADMEKLTQARRELQQAGLISNVANNPFNQHGGITDDEVRAQQALVDTLDAQIKAQKTLSDIKSQDRENAGLSTAKEERKGQDEVISAENQATNARLAGLALLRSQEAQAIDAVVRKYQEGELTKREADRETAALRTKYDADVDNALDAQRDKIEKLRAESLGAGLTGIAKVQNDLHAQLNEINRGADRDADPASLSDRSQMRILAEQKADAQILDERKKFSDEMAGIIQRSSQQETSGYAKIEGEVTAELSAIAKKYEQTFGQLDFADPANWTAMVQGLQQAGQAVDAVEQNAARARQRYAADADLKIQQTEDEAARLVLPPWQAAQQHIIDGYQERLQKVRDEVSQGTVTEEQGARAAAAAWQLANAQMVQETERTRDQLAGQLRSFFDNPTKYMQDRAKQAMFDILANWMVQLENAKGPMSTVLSSLFGQNKVPPGFGVHGGSVGHLPGLTENWGGRESTLSAQPLQIAGSTLNSAGTNLNTAAQALMNAAYARSAGSPSIAPNPTGLGGFGGGGFGAGPADLGSASPFENGGLGSAALSTASLGGQVVGGGSPSSAIGTGVDAIQQAVQVSSLVRGALNSSSGAAPLLNPSGGFQPTDIAPTNSAGVLGTLPDSGGSAPSSGASLTAAGGALSAVSGGLALYGGLSTAWNSSSFDSGLLGAASTAMTGAMLGLTFGGPIGAGIGAAAGFAAGLVADLFGDHGASKMQKYNIDTVIPQLQRDMDGFSFGSSSYDSASLDMNNLQIQALNQAKQWGSGAMGVYQNTVVPEIKNAMAQVTREGAAGRSNVTFSAAQFHSGGTITDFGDLWTSPTTGFIHAELGEHLTSRPAAGMFSSTLSQMNRGGGDLIAALRNSNAGSGGGAAAGGDNHLHVHIHTLDPKTMEHWLRNGGARMIQTHLNWFTGQYAGRALS